MKFQLWGILEGIKMKRIIKYFGAFALFFSLLFSADLDIIEAQKREQILREYERLEAARAELESYRIATKKLFDERQKQLAAQQKELNATLAAVMEREQNISRAIKASEERIALMLEKNQEILNQLNSGNSDKMLEAYAKIKDGKLAEVLGAMPPLDAARLLYKMEAKKISAVLSKMDAAKAVELTALIKEGKIFENNATNKEQNTTGD